MSHRIFRALVLDEIAEARVVAVADGRLQRDRLLRHLQHGADALDGQLDFLGDFFRRGLAAVFLHELLLHAHQLVDRLDHVHRDADGARLVGDGAGDGLANPPGGVGGKLVAAAILEFLDRLHQAHVAFLDQVEEGEAAVGVFLRDGNDEAQVGLDHFGLGLERLAQPVLQLLVLLGDIPPGLSQMRISSSRELRRRSRLGAPLSRGCLLGISARAAADQHVVLFVRQVHEFLGDLLLEVKLRDKAAAATSMRFLEIALSFFVLAALAAVRDVAAVRAWRSLRCSFSSCLQSCGSIFM